MRNGNDFIQILRLVFSVWERIFQDAKMTTAFLDRLTHKGRIVEFVGDSYRYRHRLQQDV